MNRHTGEIIPPEIFQDIIRNHKEKVKDFIPMEIPQLQSS